MATERMITCAEEGCDWNGNGVFKHVQNGRGRPPKFCPNHRVKGPQYHAKVVKADEEPVERVRVILDGEPIKVGDPVIRPLLDAYATFERACANAKTRKVVRIEGDTAYVKTREGVFPTDMAFLVKVGWQ